MDSPDSRNTEEHDKYAVVSVPTNSFCDSDIIGHMPQKIIMFLSLTRYCLDLENV